MPADHRHEADRSRPEVTADFSDQGETSAQLEPTILSSPGEIAEQSGEEPVATGRAGRKSTPPKRISSYEILSELGRGGMGVVYRAQDLRLKRIVALKVILAGGHAGQIELARFQTEAEAVARLKHQNVVQVYEAGCRRVRPPT